MPASPQSPTPSLRQPPAALSAWVSVFRFHTGEIIQRSSFSDFSHLVWYTLEIHPCGANGKIPFFSGWTAFLWRHIASLLHHHQSALGLLSLLAVVNGAAPNIGCRHLFQIVTFSPSNIHSEEGGGRGVQDGEHMYTHGWFMSTYGKTSTIV